MRSQYETTPKNETILPDLCLCARLSTAWALRTFGGPHCRRQADASDVGSIICLRDEKKEESLEFYSLFNCSLYYFQAAERGFLKPVGEWNSQRIIVNGPMVEIILNGHTILKANLDELAAKKPEHKGIKRKSGHLAFCGHGDRGAYRNLRIAEIASDDSL